MTADDIRPVCRVPSLNLNTASKFVTLPCSRSRVTILARSQYVRELPKLHRAGAEDVFSAEGEVALAFTARILERLGATGEQIDRERARVEATFRNG